MRCPRLILALTCSAAATASLASADPSGGGAATLGQLALQKVLRDSRDVFGAEDDDNEKSSAPHPYADWMARVPDDTPLARLSIPGAHDAATWNYTQATQDALACLTYSCHSNPSSSSSSSSCSSCSPSCCNGNGSSDLLLLPIPPAQVFRTQRRSIAAALDAGVRFFDLRFAGDGLGQQGRGLAFWHGAALLSARADVEGVMLAVYAWLERRPSESVLLSFQYEGGGGGGAGFDEGVQGMLKRVLGSEGASRYVRRGRGRLGSMGESRGKIVLLKRFDMDGDEDDDEDGEKAGGLPGLHLSPAKWPDNNPSGFELVYNATSGERACIEDYYGPATAGANSSVAEIVRAKMAAVKAHLEKAAAATTATSTTEEEDSLFITFASGKRNANVPPVFPETMALGNGTDVTPDGGVNHQLAALLREMRGRRLGIVVVDFFDEPGDLVELILGS
ncbi:PLC-like phosphodiesterase [Daldinia caldariorum]|uniref:PLC-like phosphodiesterase n=1 Tax=Daldinia caldariorum TaxID=326644 RepID=UPI002008D48B|nr:PLC-like phosphodiesterase [Daldinia caldariorum]KAI1465284.1 PLC-like phosphodiesterase [Daldinia caldariorum]